MRTITVKKIPDDLYNKLKEKAGINHRSINSEIIMCIESAVQSKQIDPDTFLSRIEVLQKEITVPTLTDDKISESKEKGRP